MASQIPRRDFIKVVGAAALAGPAVLRGQTPTTAPAGRRRPNIVLIVADDQRHDTIAALGNRHIQTPNLDALANDGMAFTGARCMGSANGAVCVPTRAGIHTGRQLFNVPDNIGAHATIGQTLQSAGYNAAGHGKWHNQGP
jgi:arylsulfatase A-like enzyme